MRRTAKIGVSYYEQFVWDLKHRGVGNIDIPIVWRPTIPKEPFTIRKLYLLDEVKKLNQTKRITQLLLKNNRYEEGFWPWLQKGKPVSKKAANKFMLGCILDYQVKASIAWENARRLAEDILGDPDNLWQSIIKSSKFEWNAKWKTYSLHRFPKAHERVWRIGNEIINQYEGDARNIWKAQPPYLVIDRLKKLRVGEQISRMIVGALCDTEQIPGKWRC